MRPRPRHWQHGVVTSPSTPRSSGERATAGEWLEGARPRTLPAAVAPVLAGTGVAAYLGEAVWWKAALAMVVALALQVGVNYANDYSDGIRGTDADRVGPLRLVGSGAATPGAVKAAAFAAFGVAVVAGLVLAATTSWWLVLVGALAVVAAWFYTGGKRPYGYLALGEVMVFVFFGLVAGVGTTYVQTESLPLAAWYAATGVGVLACSVLVANNLRDIPTDRVAGKRTLAVVLGEERTRLLYTLLIGAAFVALVALALATSLAALAGLVFLLPVVPAVRLVLTGTSGRALVPVLARTGLAELLWGAGVLLGLLLASR
jgi:1,4-dihydroxy-2-naphthoate polyprenyltransferase